MKFALNIKLLNIFGFSLALFVNYLSVVANLGGKTIRELSDKYNNLFTPSNQTFSIWGLIYTLIIVYLILQFFKKYWQLPITQNYLFSISCLFNASWIILWQFEFIVGSVLVMLGLLTTLAIINKQLSKEGPGIFKLIFGVYLGWICIATVANITTFFIAYGLIPDSGVQTIVTISLLIIATLLTVWLIRKLKNPFLFISVSWAFYGVYGKRIGDYPIIAYAAILAMSVVVVFALLNSSIKKNEEKIAI